MNAMARVQAAAGSLALVIVLGGYVLALARLRRAEVRDQAASRWWFGYARDGVNLAGLLLLLAAYTLAGAAGPLAFVLALLLVAVTYSLDWTFGKRLARRRAGYVLVPLLGAAAIAALHWSPLPDWLMRLILKTAPP